MKGWCETDTGVPVNPILAENLSAAFASVQLISQTIASLPLCIYRLDASGARYDDRQHPVAKLFAGDVNENQTASDFFELMQANVLWHGNAYAEIVRDGAGRPVALVPHHPGMISVERLPGRGRRLRYIVSDIGGGSRRLLQEEMLHIRDRSDDGLCGKSRLQRAREAFGSAIAAERFAARTWNNSASMSGFVSHPETLGPEAAQTFASELGRSLRRSKERGQDRRARRRHDLDRVVGLARRRAAT
jgi:HK97 family phage portal protein